VVHCTSSLAQGSPPRAATPTLSSGKPPRALCVHVGQYEPKLKRQAISLAFTHLVMPLLVLVGTSPTCTSFS